MLNNVLTWVRFYDPSFIPIFLEYNKTHLRNFSQWTTQRRFKLDKDHFINAVHNFLDYERDGRITALRTANSYLRDVIFNLGKRDALTEAYYQFALWLQKELKSHRNEKLLYTTKNGLPC